MMLMVVLLLDVALGDPPTRWHPVAWLGSLIAGLEQALRRVSWLDGRAGGVMLTVVTVLLASGVALALSVGAYRVSPFVGVGVDALLVWFTLAAWSLAVEGRAVSSALVAGDLDAARLQVARVVARRTDVLDESGVARAAVESLGENVVDGVIAPLVWAALLGPAGAWMHKAASTLDSMVGYRTPRYERFGTAAARFDDVLAWVPARLSLVLIPFAALLAGFDAAGAWRVGVRDRLKHASPNSAHGEAAFAGALGVQLGGPTAYADRVSERAVIGEGLDAPAAADPERAARLVMMTATVAMVLLALGLWVVSALG